MARSKSADFAKALEYYLPDAEIVNAKAVDSGGRIQEGQSLDRLPIQGQIDLHGQTLAEACHSVDRFLKASVKQGLRKVLIIHGKGSGVLQAGVGRYLEGHPLAGQRKPARREDGGSGALIVIVRQK